MLPCTQVLQALEGLCKQACQKWPTSPRNLILTPGQTKIKFESLKQGLFSRFFFSTTIIVKMDWFLYDRDLRHKRVKGKLLAGHSNKNFVNYARKLKQISY